MLKLVDICKELKSKGYQIALDDFIFLEMVEVLNLVPLHEDICEVLNGNSNQMKDTLDLVISVEKGVWEDVDFWCTQLQMDNNQAIRFYQEAFKWANRLMID